MTYDTSPLAIDTLDVESAPPSNELRFVPADQNIHQTNGTESDSGPISEATVLSKNVGFDTFIENRTETKAYIAAPSVGTQPNYRALAGIGLLAVVSAVAGGSVVYLLSSPQDPVSAEQKPSVANTGVTDVQATNTFIVKSPTESSAEEPLVPHSPEIAGQTPRPAHLVKPRGDEPVIDTNSNSSTAVNANGSIPMQNTTPSGTDDIQPKQPEREARVGAYVVEKPAAGRKPIARCADGTYSFSASKAAACSGRGGVSDWMADGKPASNTAAKQAAYVLGPRGGCYYLDSSNKKVYVDKKYCQ